MACSYLYDPADDTFHFWLMRRYIPVVLPALVLFAGVACSWLLARLPEPWPTVGAAVLLGCVAVFTIRAGDVLLFFAERKGRFAQLATIAAEIPGDGIILASASPDLLTPLCVSFDKPVVPVDLTCEEGQAILAAWVSSRVRMGKTAYLLQQEGSGILPPRSKELSRGWISFSYLRPSIRPLPRRIERKCIPVTLLRLDGLPERADYLDVPLERGFLLGTKATGFHREELFEGEPARWTNGAAKIMVPVDADCPPKALIVDICWSGPHAPRLQIVVNGHRLCEVTIRRQQSWSARLDLTGIPLGERLIIELLSDSFVGFEQWDPGEDCVPDRRHLGVLGARHPLDRGPGLLWPGWRAGPSGAARSTGSTSKNVSKVAPVAGPTVERRWLSRSIPGFLRGRACRSNSRPVTRRGQPSACAERHGTLPRSGPARRNLVQNNGVLGRFLAWPMARRRTSE